MSAFYDLSKTPRNILNQAIVRAIVSENDGALFDPPDLSTLYQDAAGTIPVTAVEQPVGKMLDKSGNGYHATQPITASRPTLSARYNLLTKTEDFSDAVWGKIAAGTASAPLVTNNYGLAPDGTTTAARLQMALNGGTTTTDRCCLPQGPLLTSGSSYSSIFWLKSNTAQSYVVQQRLGFSAQNITVDQTWKEYSYTQLISADNTHWLALRGAQGTSDSADILIWHPQLVIGATSGHYQRVDTATDYDTDPRYFPKYLRFDGVDDYLNLPYMGLYANGSASSVIAMDTIITASQQNYLTEASSTSSPPLYYLDFQRAGRLGRGFFIRNDASIPLANFSSSAGESVSTANVKTMVDNGQNVKKYRNGTLLNSDNYVRSGTLSLSSTVIGAVGYAPPVNFAKMNLYGMIITKSALTDSQRVACERFEARKSGVLM